MKTLNIIIAISLFSFFSYAQETEINWLSVSEFESSVNEGESNCLIFIEGSSYGKMSKEQLDERNKRMTAFLQNTELASYVNQNFICFKFNPSLETIKFKGSEYSKVENNGRSSHEFTKFLTGSDRNRLPAIVVRDKGFNLFSYTANKVDGKALEHIVAAEKLKMEYLKSNVSEDNSALRRSNSELTRAQKALDSHKAEGEKKTTSVLAGRQKANMLLNTLRYFVENKYEDQDLNSFLESTKK